MIKSLIYLTQMNAHVKTALFIVNCSDERHTVFWREFIVGVFVDVVAPDGDIDTIREWPVPLHIPFVSVD